MLLLGRCVDEEVRLDFSQMSERDLAELRSTPIVIKVTEIRARDDGKSARLGFTLPDFVQVSRPDMKRTTPHRKQVLR